MAYAIFGDSYIRRLDKYTNGRMHWRYECKFFGVSGMSTTKKIQPMFDRLLSSCPRYVFLNVGGNDIDASCNPHTIFMNIVNIVQDLEHSGVERVFVASIIERGSFPKWTGMNQKTFNKIRRSVNEKLRKHFKGDYVDVAKRLIYPRHYDKDNVNPGFEEGGLKVLMHTIRKNFNKTLG